MGILLPKTEQAVERKAAHIVTETCISVKTIEDACKLVHIKNMICVWENFFKT